MQIHYRVIRSLELLGFRQISSAMVGLFRQPRLPKTGVLFDDSNWTFEQLVALRGEALYFTVGNSVRLLFCIPVILELETLQSKFVLWLFAILAALHLLLVVAEFYRFILASYLIPLSVPGGFAEQPQDSAPLKRSFYFTPFSFETPAFYQILGMEWAQGRVLWWDGLFRKWAGWVPAAQARVERPSLQSLLKFEAATRTAEMTHLFVTLPNGIALAYLARVGSPVAIIAGAVVWFDLGLVLLQRYNRVRVIPLISKLQRRANRLKGP